MRNTPLHCDICGLVLSRGDTLTRHKRDKHPDAAAALPCITCNRVFFTKTALAQHLRLNKCAVDLGPATLPVALPSGAGEMVSSSSSPFPAAAAEQSPGSTSALELVIVAAGEPQAARTSDADVDAAITDFLGWLDVPASNRDERSLKQARVKIGTTQYKEAVSTLRRLL